MIPPEHDTPALRDLRRAFQAATGAAPAFASRAPGRVNLIGDHVDYAGGLVLPMAIDRACHAVGGRTAPRARFRVHSMNLGLSFDVPTDEPITPGKTVPVGHWASYAVGASAELAASVPGIDLDRLEIMVSSSVPPGAGLSSSAALEAAVATLVARACAVNIEPMGLALLCQRAEHRFAGVPCGLMDQAAVVLAREGSLLLLDCLDRAVRHVPSPPGARYFVIDTGVRHAHAGGAYAARRDASDGAARSLGVPSLRDALGDSWRTCVDALAPEQRDAARHITGEIGRVARAAAALESGDLPRVGALMVESHASLRDVYRVSCPELDAVVGAALACAGVHGARMTGGGFGGCAVALVGADGASDFVSGFRRALGAGPARNPGVFEVRPSAGAASDADLGVRG